MKHDLGECIEGGMRRDLRDHLLDHLYGSLRVNLRESDNLWNRLRRSLFHRLLYKNIKNTLRNGQWNTI